jgi:cytochrome c5
MNNIYLKRSDIWGGIALSIIAISALLYFSLPILNKGSNTDSNEDIDTRTHPVGQVQIAEQNISSITQVNNDAVETELITAISVEEASSNSAIEDLTKASCFACHQTGLMGAPKVGSRSDWEKRLEQGFDILVLHAREGLNSMPARGGNPALSDTEVENAILFMLEQSELTVPGKTLASVPSATPKVEVVAISATDESPDVQAEQENGLEEVVTNNELKNQMEEPDTTPDSFDDQVTQEIEEQQEQTVVKILPGKEFYDNICASCHKSGSNKSPRVGEQNEWTASFAKGIDALTKVVVEGPPSHPKDGESELTDVQIRNAIEYIMQQTFWPSSE